MELQSDSIDRSVRVPVKDVFPTLKDTVMVSGRVLEETDSLKEYPLYGAVLLFHLNDSTTQGCVAGIDGNFIIKLGHVKIGDTITVEVKYTGYQPYFTTIVLRNPEIKHTDIILRGEAAITDSHIVGAIPAENHPVRAKIRRFFWRLFHPLYWGL